MVSDARSRDAAAVVREICAAAQVFHNPQLGGFTTSSPAKDPLPWSPSLIATAQALSARANSTFLQSLGADPLPAGEVRLLAPRVSVFGPPCLPVSYALSCLKGQPALAPTFLPQLVSSGLGSSGSKERLMDFPTRLSRTDLREVFLMKLRRGFVKAGLNLQSVQLHTDRASVDSFRLTGGGFDVTVTTDLQQVWLVSAASLVPHSSVIVDRKFAACLQKAIAKLGPHPRVSQVLSELVRVASLASSQSRVQSLTDVARAHGSFCESFVDDRQSQGEEGLHGMVVGVMGACFAQKTAAYQSNGKSDCHCVVVRIRAGAMDVSCPFKASPGQRDWAAMINGDDLHLNDVMRTAQSEVTQLELVLTQYRQRYTRALSILLAAALRPSHDHVDRGSEKKETENCRCVENILTDKKLDLQVSKGLGSFDRAVALLRRICVFGTWLTARDCARQVGLHCLLTPAQGAGGRSPEVWLSLGVACGAVGLETWLQGVNEEGEGMFPEYGLLDAGVMPTTSIVELPDRSDTFADMWSEAGNTNTRAALMKFTLDDNMGGKDPFCTLVAIFEGDTLRSLTFWSVDSSCYLGEEKAFSNTADPSEWHRVVLAGRQLIAHLRPAIKATHMLAPYIPGDSCFSPTVSHQDDNSEFDLDIVQICRPEALDNVPIFSRASLVCNGDGDSSPAHLLLNIGHMMDDGRLVAVYQDAIRGNKTNSSCLKILVDQKERTCIIYMASWSDSIDIRQFLRRVRILLEADT